MRKRSDERDERRPAGAVELKVHTAVVDGKEIEARGLTQAHAAGLLGITQPDLSDIVRGRLSGWSLERLTRLGRGVEITQRVNRASGGVSEPGGSDGCEVGSRERLVSNRCKQSGYARGTLLCCSSYRGFFLPVPGATAGLLVRRNSSGQKSLRGDCQFP